jgi:lysozyme
VLRHINEGAYLQAAAALEMWRRAELDGEGIVVDALVRRRAAEKALFLKPAAGQHPGARSVLHPAVDRDASTPSPQSSEEVETPLDGDDAIAIRLRGGSRARARAD